MKEKDQMPKRQFEGKIISDKMEKTVTVAVEVFKRHPIYGRAIKNTRKFKAHNDALTLVKGDIVLIEESRPFSKEVTWKVIEKREAK
jgi:small subunit ribosomal protein S17